MFNVLLVLPCLGKCSLQQFCTEYPSNVLFCITYPELLDDVLTLSNVYTKCSPPLSLIVT